MTIKQKVTLAIIAMALTPLLIASLLLNSTATLIANESLEEAAKNQLTAIRDSKKSQIEDYFATIRGQILTYSNNGMIISAMEEFAAAFKEVPSIDAESVKRELARYYQDPFDAEYRNQNSGQSAGISGLLNQLDSLIPSEFFNVSIYTLQKQRYFNVHNIPLLCGYTK